MTTYDCHSFFKLSIHHIEQAHHIFIIYKPTINQEQFKTVIGFPNWWWRYFIDDPSK